MNRNTPCLRPLFLSLCCLLLWPAPAYNQAFEALYTHTENDSIAMADIAPANDGGLWVLATVVRTLATNDLNASDGLVLRLDAQGTLLWSKEYDAGTFQNLNDIQGTPDGGFIIGGTTNLVHALDPACRLINLSTDVVFAGDAAPYKEEDPPAPRHEYGRCKASAEGRAAAHANQVTVRTSLIFGLRIPDRGLEGFQQRLAAGETLTLFNNQWRNPIWADALAHACLELLNLPYRGLLHVAGAEAVDRASYSQALLAHWGIAAPDKIQIGADQTGQYPLDTRLDISQAQRLLKTPLPGFFDVLARHNPSPK